MQYYLLEASFIENHPVGSELQLAIDAHLEYLRTGFNSDSILISGPKVGTSGGILIMKCHQRQDVDVFCANDPIVQAGIQEYRIIEFNPFLIQESTKNWFDLR